MGSVPVAIWSAAGRLMPLYDAEDATRLPVNLQGTTPAMLYSSGLVLGEVTATAGLYAPYNPAASDGTQTAKGILEYHASVLGTAGAVGAITSYGGEWPGFTLNALPCYKSGDFDLSQIYGLDAAAVTSLAGRIVEGALGVNEVDSLASTATGGTFALTIPAVTVAGNAYPAVTLPTIAFGVTTAALVAAINAALVAAGIPGNVTATGAGPLGSTAIVLTFHEALGGQPIVLGIDNTLATGGTVVNTRQTSGVAGHGVIRFG